MPDCKCVADKKRPSPRLAFSRLREKVAEGRMRVASPRAPVPRLLRMQLVPGAMVVSLELVSNAFERAPKVLHGTPRKFVYRGT